MVKILHFTVPIYILFFGLTRLGMFAHVETFMTLHLPFLDWLCPEAMAIIILHVAAEFSAGIAAAGALLANGTMSDREIVLALLVGNILSGSGISSPVSILCWYFQTCPCHRTYYFQPEFSPVQCGGGYGCVLFFLLDDVQGTKDGAGKRI